MTQMNSNLSIRVISQLNDFHELRSDWNDLVSRSANDVPFLRHEWFTAWLDSFGVGERIFIIVAYDYNKMVFALPMIEKRRTFLRQIVLTSIENVNSCRYHFLLEAGREDILPDIVSFLCNKYQSWHLIILRQMPSTWEGQSHLKRILEKNKLLLGYSHFMESPFLQISGSWDEFYGKLKTKFRKNLRKRLKLLEEVGEVSCELVCNSREVGHALEDALRIESLGYKGRSGTAILCEPKILKFIRDIGMLADEVGWLHLFFLRINDKRIAFILSLVYQKKMYSLKTSYDPAYSIYSPGQLLHSMILERCFDEEYGSIKEFDFLGASTVHKTDWNPQMKIISTLEIYNKTFLGKLEFWFMHRLFYPKIKTFLNNNNLFMRLLWTMRNLRSLLSRPAKAI